MPDGDPTNRHPAFSFLKHSHPGCGADGRSRLPLYLLAPTASVLRQRRAEHKSSHGVAGILCAWRLDTQDGCT